MNPFLRLFGFLLLGMLLVQADRRALAESLAAVRIDQLGAAIGLVLLWIALRAARWNRMLRFQRIAYSYPRALLVYLSGIYIGLATPGGLGELAKALYVKRDQNASAGVALSAAVLDHLLDLYALVTIGLVGCFHFAVFGPASPVFLFPVTCLVALPFFAFSPTARRRFTREFLGGQIRTRFARILADGTEDFFSAVEKMIAPRFVMWWVLTGLAYLCFLKAGHLTAESLGIEIGFADAALVLALSNLLALAPITVAGVGTRDVLFVYAFAALALRQSDALAFSAVILVTVYLLPGLIGLLCFLADRPTAYRRRRGSTPHPA